MGDLPYISSEEGGGLIIHTELIYEYTISVWIITVGHRSFAEPQTLMAEC